MKGLEAKTLGLRKVIRHEYKRIVAFMLTVAMVVTNFGTNLTVAFAQAKKKALCSCLTAANLRMRSAQLWKVAIGTKPCAKPARGTLTTSMAL